MSAKKECFFITPIGKPNSAARKRSDDIKTYILDEVFKGKFNVVRADEISKPGSITHQVIELLYNADVVVADLTGLNPNVVYELAVRHSFNKTSIHLINKEEQVPFDLKDERTIFFDLLDPRSLDKCKQEFERIIKELSQKDFKYSSPIFRALAVAAATNEEREAALGTVLDQVNAIATYVSRIEWNRARTGSEDADGVKSDIQKILDRLNKVQRVTESISRFITEDLQFKVMR